MMDVLNLRAKDTAVPQRKLAGFDAIRAIAALGVVLLHSCVPYLRHPMPGLAWPVQDGSSDVVDFGFWWIELFIMPLFLLLAGYFAWQTLMRRGAVQLVRNRSKRLLIPLLFGILVILPLDAYCWVLGWVTEGLVEPIKLRSFKFDNNLDKDLWGLSHLWFLQYLFLYVVVLASFAMIRDRSPRLSRLTFSPAIVVAAVVIVGSVVLWARPQVVWGFQHAALPVPSKWIYSGLFFALGAMVAAYDGQFTWLQRNVNRLWMPAACVSVAAVMLGRWHLAGGDQQLAGITLAILTCASGMLMTLSIVGWAVKRIDHVSVSISYLAAASFWVYLMHHPILGLVHIDLKWLLPGLSPLLKTVISFAAASGVSLLLYEGLVRKTRLGRWLGFTWQPPAPEQTIGARDVIAVGDFSAAEQPSPATRRAA